MTITLLEALKNLQSPDFDLDTDTGICWNVSRQIFDGQIFDGQIVKSYKKQLTGIFQKWPKYSGNADYPVTSTDKCADEEMMYNSVQNLWIDDYGDLRKELLQFCIDYLEKQNEKNLG